MACACGCGGEGARTQSMLSLVGSGSAALKLVDMFGLAQACNLKVQIWHFLAWALMRSRNALSL